MSPRATASFAFPTLPYVVSTLNRESNRGIVRASKASRQENYRKDDGSERVGARVVAKKRGSVRARRSAVDASERENCTYKSLNRCFSRIRKSRKTFPPLLSLRHPVARGGFLVAFVLRMLDAHERRHAFSTMAATFVALFHNAWEIAARSAFQLISFLKERTTEDIRNAGINANKKQICMSRSFKTIVYCCRNLSFI